MQVALLLLVLLAMTLNYPRAQVAILTRVDKFDEHSVASQSFIEQRA